MVADVVVQHGVSTARACLMSPSCERHERKRSKETAGIANWKGIKVDVSLPAMHVLRSLSQIIEWRESLKPCEVITGPNMSIVC
jgi:hypothetical protein